MIFKGTAKSKLNSLWKFIFEVCREMFGELRRNEPTAPRKGRRERDGTTDKRLTPTPSEL